MEAEVETNRKLASVQRVVSVDPIAGADAIECIRIQGWVVVVKKGDYKVGDMVVYCEIDSLLPEREEFEFLRPRCFREATEDRPAGFRIKTVRLRGQVSQGIVFPVSILGDSEWQEGSDVTKILGIVKFELPEISGLQDKAKGYFPAFLPKTDEIRIQNVSGVLSRHAGEKFSLTEKLDGTSFTAFVREGEFGICSRNLHLDDTDESGVLSEVARRLGVKEKLVSLGFNVAIQGEVCGPGIQGNKYKLQERSLFVFNLIDIDKREILPLAALNGIFNTVPQLGEFVMRHTVDQMVQMSQGKSALNQSIEREGVVVRPVRQITDPMLNGRFSFKVINPLFLLKFDT